MSQDTMWQRFKTGGKSGFDKTWKALDKLGAPVNRLSNKLGSEAFWPTTLDKESDKAARILKSFCKDGFYAEEEVQPADGPKQKQKVIQKIPEKVIRNAKGLAIFTTMRTGLWISGAGGSGVLVARKEDGTWSPPSGILLHTAGLGFLVGIDIYDCVVVINSDQAMEAFTKVRCTLGSEISISAGPVGAGGVLDTEIHKRQAPIYTYLKSRGFYAGVQIDGTIVIERMDENERFYGQKLPVKDILAGKVRHPPYEVKRLMETIKAAQGDSDFDESMIPTEAPPGDYEIESGQSFGVPDKDDPDPYGVLALEKEGMSLKEAATKKRASWEEFTFNPSPSSPVHGIYQRQSQDLSGRASSRRNSWRSSAFANEPKTPSSLRNSMDVARSPVMADSSTQTDLTDRPWSPIRRSSAHSSRGSISAGHTSQMQDVPENEVLKTEPVQPISTVHANGYTTPPRTPPATHEPEVKQVAVEQPEYDDDEEEVHIEEPVVHSVQTVQPAQTQAISKARIVEVPKRLPPKLPPRNPSRNGLLASSASPTDASSDKSTSLELPRQEHAASEAGKTTSIELPQEERSTYQVVEKLETIKLDSDDEGAHKQQRRSDDKEDAKMPGAF